MNKEESFKLNQKLQKTDLQMFANLNLGKNTAEAISAAEELIRKKDTDGSKLEIFKEALNYYTIESDYLAELPVFHSTGSYALAKILENGGLDSTKNLGVTGEKRETKAKNDFTSLVISGYAQAEVISHFYARKNEKQSSLILDRKEITGKEPEDDLEVIYRELPGLKEDERRHVLNELKKYKKDENIDDETLLNSKINELKSSSFYFKKDEVENELKNKKKGLKKTARAWLAETILNKQKPKEPWRELLEADVSSLQQLINFYKSENEILKKEMLNPFPVILTYEGKNLPIKDLTTLTSILVSERRIQSVISNNLLRQIQVPNNKIELVKKWISMLPENMKGELSGVKIIPLEYYEAKKIIQDNLPQDNKTVTKNVSEELDLDVNIEAIKIEDSNNLLEVRRQIENEKNKTD